MDADSLRLAVLDGMSTTRADLERLVRLPSIAFDGFDRAPVHGAAELTAQILREAGLRDVRLLDIPDSAPAVFGELPAPDGAPTVLLYAHYDVQPAGDEAKWTSPPWEPTERNGRLYGRGTADDKSGIVTHAAALRAWGGKPPVGVKVLIEGEEETGSGAIDAYVAAHPDLFAADVIAVADSGNWKLGEPTLNTSLRGMAMCTVEVRTIASPVHSGLFGGAVPDALMELIGLLSTLTDADGHPAIAGLTSEEWDGLQVDETTVREGAYVLDGVDLIGRGSLASRMWSRPSVTVIGLDAPSTHGARNALVPNARAIIGLRLHPADDPADGARLLGEHLRAHARSGILVDVESGAGGFGHQTSVDGPGCAAAMRAMATAYGKEAVTMGSGGSIPLVHALAAALPGVEIVLWGPVDDAANMHAADESLHLEEFERACVTEALFLGELAKR